MSMPPQTTMLHDSSGGAPPYMYMKMLEKVFDQPKQLLESFQIPYHRRTYLLKQWRNDRSRYLAENCRDMDYMQDAEMDGLLHALNALKQQPRRYV